MSWVNSLLDASFRGVQFDVLATDDSVSRALQITEYPWRDGAQIDDMGASARRIRIQALFNGPDYEAALGQFIAALNQGGEGELVHPVFGSVKVHAAGWSAPHRAEDPDYCLLSVDFVEAALPVALFSGKPAQAVAVGVQSAADKAEALGGAVFAKQVTALAAAATNGRETTILSDALGAVLNTARLLSPHTVLASLPGISQPLSWASDLRAIVGGLRETTRLALGLESFDPLTLMADFFGFTGLLDDWPAVDTPGGSYASRVKNTVAAQTNLTPTLEVARVASDILAQEAVAPTLSPVEIGRIADAARSRLQASIDECEAAYELVDSRPLIEALRETAHAVLAAARAVIEVRPPIIRRAVETDCNLHRLAHLWYGDWTRAYELQRLNPQVRNPNFILQGAVLNAYAA
jgi:prophage DNA circulation protein